jgi:transcription factor TFB4
MEELVVIVDTAARSWESPRCDRSLSFEKFQDLVVSFICVVACSSRGALPVVLAYNGSCGGYLWPPATLSAGHSGVALLRKRVELGLMSLRYQRHIDSLLDCDDDFKLRSILGTSSRLTSLAACLCAAICRHNRIHSSHPTHRSRILVLQAGPDVATDYTATMNAVYSCQRLGVPIDSVDIFGPTSAPGARSSATEKLLVLQQASHISGGIHGAPTSTQRSSLLEYLVAAFLPDASLRRFPLLLPPAAGADLRAHCFCHSKQQSVAWICSVCLAVWCELNRECAACGTKSSPVRRPPVKD